MLDNSLAIGKRISDSLNEEIIEVISDSYKYETLGLENVFTTLKTLSEKNIKYLHCYIKLLNDFNHTPALSLLKLINSFFRNPDVFETESFYYFIDNKKNLNNYQFYYLLDKLLCKRFFIRNKDSKCFKFLDLIICQLPEILAEKKEDSSQINRPVK